MSKNFKRGTSAQAQQNKNGYNDNKTQFAYNERTGEFELNQEQCIGKASFIASREMKRKAEDIKQLGFLERALTKCKVNLEGGKFYIEGNVQDVMDFLRQEFLK